ncbi:MAG TPA: S-methyl-5-thioribose-1-phosphate isomerase [Victivallales bacterium]|nr:S-methyl-5-thioribose-1-phosphate isomerase [Victivallales bacterium]HPO90540.1 S-methyl-5-thioribose-1-phosphate isomerase [Victivallales bacterium]HRU01173.1 S-methyl-5-thioribose-1-phosphate isomerase [Victivallales bacterium]
MIDTVRWLDSKGNILSSVSEKAIELIPGKLRIIDQTLLPGRLEYIETDELDVIFNSIKRLSVRGAPAIGCAAALGLAAVMGKKKLKNRDDFISELTKSAKFLESSRPTAVNLSWALKRCITRIEISEEFSPEALKILLTIEALSILEEDISMCRAIGEEGVKLIKDGYGLLTHCNAGALATGDFGTALSPIYTAKERGMELTVYSDETRPLLQGARLTAWELQRAGIKVFTICDNMAGQVMREGRVNIVIVGADRIAANGDTANKIGTYGLAIIANYHKIPFYVAAPYSTIDISTNSGEKIPIEQRNEEEITVFNGKRISPDNIQVYNPAFDVTPSELISGIITEKGILYPPFKKSIRDFIDKKTSFFTKNA